MKSKILAKRRRLLKQEIKQEIPIEQEEAKRFALFYHDHIQSDNLNSDECFIVSEKADKMSILKYLGDYMKFSPTNIDSITSFLLQIPILNEACDVYSQIIRMADNNQPNFLNIYILNYLLMNLTDQNIELFAIYAHLFLIGNDANSFSHACFSISRARPSDVFLIARFLFEFNKIENIQESLKTYVTTFNRFIYTHEYRAGENITKDPVQILFYFLLKFELIKVCHISPFDCQAAYEMQAKYFDLPLDMYSFSTKELYNEPDHYKHLKNGTTTNFLYNIIKNDDIDAFQREASQPDFDPNKNLDNNFYSCLYITGNFIAIIEIAAFFNSIKIFKFLKMNGATNTQTLANCAIASGNPEIIHLCEQMNCVFDKKTFLTAIMFHQNEVFRWLLDNKLKNLLFFETQNVVHELAAACVKFDNPIALNYLIENSFQFPALLVDSYIYLDEQWIKYLLSFDFINIKTRSVLNNNTIFNQMVSMDRLDILKLFHKISPQFVNDIQFDHDSRFLLDVLRYGRAKTLIYWLNLKNIFYQMNKIQIHPKYSDDVIYQAFLLTSPYRLVEYGCQTRELYLFFLKKKIFNWEFSVSKLYEIALKHYDKSICDFILSNQIEISPHDSEVVFSAIFYSDWREVAKRNWWIHMEFFIKHLKLNFNASDKKGFTPLHYACYYGNNLMTLFLFMRNDIDANKRCNIDLQSPLLLAASSGFTLIIDFLLQYSNADINAITKENKNAFYLACENNYYEIVDYLLSSTNIDPNVCDINGKTGLFVACERGFHKIVVRILKCQKIKTEISYNGWTPFTIAVENWHYKVIDELIKNENYIFYDLLKYDNINNHKNTDESPKNYKNNDKDLSVIHELDNKPNYNRFSALQIACLSGNLKILQKLFDVTVFDKGIKDYISFDRF